MFMIFGRTVILPLKLEHTLVCQADHLPSTSAIGKEGIFKISAKPLDFLPKMERDICHHIVESRVKNSWEETYVSNPAGQKAGIHTNIHTKKGYEKNEK